MTPSLPWMLMPLDVFFLLVMMISLPLAVIAIPILLIVTYHKRKMEQIKLQTQGAMTQEVRAEFAALRSEIQALRDTSTQYDLSFDTALQQMDRRMEYLERRTMAQTDTDPTYNLPLGGRKP